MTSHTARSLRYQLEAHIQSMELMDNHIMSNFNQRSDMLRFRLLSIQCMLLKFMPQKSIMTQFHTLLDHMRLIIHVLESLRRR